MPLGNSGAFVPRRDNPSGPSYYPGQGTRKACTLSMEAALSAQARMKRQGLELIFSSHAKLERANHSMLHALERLGGVSRRMDWYSCSTSCLMPHAVPN